MPNPMSPHSLQRAQLPDPKHHTPQGSVAARVLQKASPILRLDFWSSLHQLMLVLLLSSLKIAKLKG